jgi:glucose/mannose-6-phosphate isomerase
MFSLDNPESYSLFDKSNMLSNILDLPDQIATAYDQLKKFPLPSTYINAKNIVILGMGGSAIGGALVASLAKEARLPIFIHRDYEIPRFVSKESLVIAVSYSGNTEETLTGFIQAAEKGAKIVVATCGGKIGSIATRYKAPVYKINYGAQPRAALGYLFTSVLMFLEKIGQFDIDQDKIRESLLLMKGFRNKIGPQVASSENLAKQIAKNLVNKIPVFIGSGILSDVARRWKTQTNENAKQAAFFETLPEADHNFIVGQENPKDLRNKIWVVFLTSRYDHPRNILRHKITVEILQKANTPYETVMIPIATSPLSEQLLSIYLGDFVSYYLALQNRVDPTEIPNINYLKDKLAEKPLEY